MSATDLIARIDAARDQNQSARDHLTEIGGVAVGISAGIAIELRPARQLANQLKEARATLRELPRTTKGADAGVRGGQHIHSGFSNRNLVYGVEARSAQVDTEFRPVGAPDKLGPGSFLHSHAERQAEVAHPNRPIAVNQPMCSRWGESSCISHFQNVAAHDDQIKVVADPDTTRVFHPDSHIDEISHNTSNRSLFQQAVEVTARPIHEQGGLSSTLMNGLENAHIRRGLRALGPIGAVLDGVSLYRAYEADGGRFGEEFKTTAGGVVGGIVGGAATGAAIGTLVPIPIVGTVVGGLIGGILGSMAGETIGEAL